MKKLLLFLVLSGWVLRGFAQTSSAPTRWQQHADSIFQHIDRSQVSTGLLVNYGFALKDYNQFQGTALTTANRLRSLAEWRLLYTALQTSVFNANATLPTLLLANQRIAQAQQNTSVVSIATLLARYDRFRDDAGTTGLVTVSNRQLYDVPGRPRSPYQQRTLVALCPLQAVLDTRTPQFSIPATLRFTNAAPAVTSLELDAGDGQGYRPVVGKGQTLGASYAANGHYTLRFRLTCADGSVLLSQADIEVQQPDVNAARYNSNAITQHSSALFTDTRAYNGVVAGGKVTVAYADGNPTGTIRKPLIIFEGYDVSHALNNQKYNVSYNNFITGDIYGAINTVYNPVAGSNDRNRFRDQLSDVGQYDIIFLDYDNGTDYIQRNAYLAERLIQWVNDNKQPLNGVRQQNVVMGMSMGGLVARYALRDMEVRRAANPSLPAHDTRLYISHEAPHQGANVPLGFQYMVKSVAAISLLPFYTLGQANPELGSAAALLEEPATQQLLIYQTDPRGGNLHNAWLQEYNQLGYPTQCRNVATSGGSECGRPQRFAPGARLLTIQGSGLLDDDYNNYANAGLFALGFGAGAIGGPVGLIVGASVGFIFSLGNFEGHVDFTVNALPSQQQQSIFHGRFSVCKDILFGAFSTCLLDYADDNNSETYMLPYDSAPGGIYDLDQVSGGALGKIGPSIPVAGVSAKVETTFCFVPTTSALDIGNNSVAFTPQDLTASYINTAPPAAPRNTPFANFITGVRDNLTHILWNGLNSKWVFREMEQVPQNVSCLAFCQAEPTISGPGIICDTGATFSISGLPAGTQASWNLSTSATVSTYSVTGPSFTTAYTGANTNYGGAGVLTVTLISECGTLSLQKAVFAGPPDLPVVSGPSEVYDCSAGGPTFFIDNYNTALSYTFTASPQIQLRPFRSGIIYSLTRRTGAGYITVTATNDCGTSLSTQFDFTVVPCTAYTVYPNPADDQLTVEQTDSTSTPRPAAARGASATTSSTVASTPYTVRLFDGYGVQRAQQATTTPSLSLPTGGLPTGLYLLHIEVGGTVVERRRMQITH
jgi:hypothetical protein